MYNEDDFSEAGPLDVEASELPDLTPETEVVVDLPPPVSEASMLIAIYKLQKAGFVPSDFK